MNQIETIGLWLQGRAAWNKWAEAMLAERKALEASGEWNAEKDLLGKLKANNEKTQAWLDKTRADFSSYLFYTSVNFEGYHFPGDTDFGSSAPDENTGGIERVPVCFESAVKFNGASFDGEVDFIGTSFEAGASFNGASFDGEVDFIGTSFEAGASFKGTRFNAKAIFKGASFAAGANFTGTEFRANATFDNTTFASNTIFDQATFGRYAWFVGAKFKNDVSFDGARFKKDVGFVGASFENAGFEGTIFDADACFDRTRFNGDTAFVGATFRNNSKFIGAKFKKFAEFDGTRYERRADFTDVTFESDLIAGSVAFLGDTVFEGAKFLGSTGFNSSRFEDATSFARAIFFGPANFKAIKVKDTFSLADTTFRQLPDFTQSNFAVAPEFNRMKLSGAVEAGDFWGSLFQRTDDSGTTKYRVLKRLAAEGYDHEQQQIFFSGEQRARRGSIDHWWHWRYWFGIFYELLSDFGRSLVRPLILLSVAVVGFALFYLGQHFNAAREDAKPYPVSASSYISHWAGSRITPALRSIYQAPTASRQMPDQLSCLKQAGETTPLSAAFYLSLKKSLLALVYERADRLDNDLACLFGATTNFRGEILPRIPATVRLWSIVQTILSVSLIFLFLLALRNHFRGR